MMTLNPSHWTLKTGNLAYIFSAICVFPVSVLGGHFEGEVSENWGHQTGDTN